MASRISTSILTGARRTFSTGTKAPVKVAVTGASGAIGYALLFRIASGDMLGKDTPVVLNLVDLPNMMDACQGVVMELNDCAFPLLQGINVASDLNQGFEDIDYALLVGAKPRGPGMDRSDLIKENGKIFTGTGKALNDNAKKTCRTLVVGNPANTNALIAASNAPDLAPENFSAMTQLDHNRGLAMLADKYNSDVSSIENFCIWGNHSSTQFPDISNTTINGKKVEMEDQYYKDTFIPKVAERGAAIIKARGASSAASAANAAIDHIRNWHLGTNGKWVSMALPSDGSYGIPEGVYYSYPVTVDANGKTEIVQGLEVNEFSRQKMDASYDELVKEREIIKDLL